MDLIDIDLWKLSFKASELFLYKQDRFYAISIVNGDDPY